MLKKAPVFCCVKCLYIDSWSQLPLPKRYTYNEQDKSISYFRKRFGHKALLKTLKIIEAKNIENLQLVISFVNTKINSDSKIIDEKTLVDVKNLIAAFIENCE